MKLQLKSFMYFLLGLMIMVSQDAMAIDPYSPAIPQLGGTNTEGDEDDDEEDDGNPGGGRVDSGGLIIGNQTMCSAIAPETILNEESPSGSFVELLQVRWEKKVVGGSWTPIYGANSLSYSPGTILVTTEFKRGCREFDGDPWIYSNIIKKERVDGIDAVTITRSNVTCKNGNDGYAKATVSGGTPGYTFAWSTGATNFELNNLVAGEYYVVATDAYGCSKTSNEIVITQPQKTIDLTTLFIFEPNCPGDSSGAISVEAFDGIAPYTYTWSNGEVGASNYDLPSGIYTVTVEDALGCEFVANDIELTQPAPFNLSSSNQDVTCLGLNNGSSTVSIEGGTAPYSYYWPDGANSDYHDDLSAGIYDILVVDAKNCLFTEEIEIAEPDSLLMETYVVNNKLCKATASILPDGGTAPYLYEWEDMGVQSSPFMTDLCPGKYAVRVIDNNGCSRLDSIEISADYAKEVIDITIMVNPFNKEGNLIVYLPYEYPAQISVYSPTGQLIEFFDNVNSANEKEIKFSLDMSKYSNGVYLVNVTSGGLTQTEKIIIRN